MFLPLESRLWQQLPLLHYLACYTNMFHKEGSSVLDLKNDRKPYKDITLRKSDRKRLLQSALQYFHNSDEVDVSSNNNNTSLNINAVLEDIFLRNDANLFQRTCHVLLSWENATLPVTVHLYFRSPQSSSADLTSSAWSYVLNPQCIWMQLIMDARQRWDLPGVALCSVLPPACYQHRITSIPSPVSEFVCAKGVKHIMRVGIRAVPNAPKQYDAMNSVPNPSMVTLICVQGNPQPLAVGLLHADLLSHRNADDPPRFGPRGPKGIGVTIIHSYGDDIWRQQLPTTKELDRIRSAAAAPFTNTPMKSSRDTAVLHSPLGGSVYDAGHYGNIGFINGKYVQPIHDHYKEHIVEPSPIESVTEVRISVPASVPADYTSHTESTLKAMTIREGEDDVQPVDHDENDVVDMVESAPYGDDNSCLPNAEEILHDAVCRALAALNPKRDLPMTMANFCALHVLPHRREGTTIQLKQTRYKKFSSYVTEQVVAGLLVAGKHDSGTSKDPMGMLVGFDRRHVDVVPYISARKEHVATAASTADGVEKRLIMMDLYCIPNHFVDILKLDRSAVKASNATSEERRGTGMLTTKEVRAVLEDYIAKEELIPEKSPDVVMLNGPLTDVLYKRKIKKDTNSTNPSSTPLSLPRKDLVNMWLACQEPAYALVQVPGNAVLKLKRGKPPTITIEVSRRQSSKYLTTVMGLELFDINADEFAKDVANRFACASTTSKVSPSTAEAVILQGNFATEIEALLLSDERLTQHGGVKGATYFLPKNSIQVVLKKGVPARKKAQVSK
jgi:translation initiation factor 2D